MNVPLTPFDGRSSSEKGLQFLFQGGLAKTGQFFDPILYGEAVAIIHENTPSCNEWTPFCRVMAFAPLMYDAAKLLFDWHESGTGNIDTVLQHAQETIDRVEMNGKDVIADGCTGRLSVKRSTGLEVKPHCTLIEYDANRKPIDKVSIFAHESSSLAILLLNARELYFGVDAILNYHRQYGFDRETNWHMIRNPIENIAANALQFS